MAPEILCGLRLLSLSHSIGDRTATTEPLPQTVTVNQDRAEETYHLPSNHQRMVVTVMLSVVVINITAKPLLN